MNPKLKQKQINLINEFLNWQDVFGAGHLRCPQHRHHVRGEDAHPSAFVYPNGIYCFGCGWHTNDILEACEIFLDMRPDAARRKLLQHLKRRPPRVEDARQKQPIPLSKVDGWIKNLQAHDMAYIYKVWGIEPRIQQAALLGYNERAFIIPHVGLDGRIWAVKFRRDDRKGTEGTKYWSAAHRSFDFLYPSFEVWKMIKQDMPSRILLCEGEFDALAAVSAGHAAVSLPSGAATSPDKWDWFWDKLDQAGVSVYLAFDQDKAGQRAGRQVRHYLEKIVPDLLVIDLEWDGAKDVAELVAQGRNLL